MKPLPQRITDYIRNEELLKPGHRLGVAVSGGLDSVALLRLALDLRDKLGIVLAVVHFNHRLRGDESEADEQFVAGLARHHDLQFHCNGGDVRGHTLRHSLSLEAAARELRYNFFRELLKAKVLDRIATAHTLDDQAETVILRLARGAGTKGLAGIYPQVDVPPGKIIRPLLKIKRPELEVYLRSQNQDWREDKSNDDLCHARNRVRHNVLPILERELNPSLRETLAETADLARDEEAYWKHEVERVLPRVTTQPAEKRIPAQVSGEADASALRYPRFFSPGSSLRGSGVGAEEADTLNIPKLLALPRALQRRIIRQVAENLGLSLELKHVREILQVAQGEATSTELPDGWSVIRSQDQLRFQQQAAPPQTDYEYLLSIPGAVEIPETHTRFEATTVSNPDGGLDASLLKKPLTVRNWRPGDRFWPVHSKSPKKVKELLQERKITGHERKIWPVVACGDAVVWLRGFPSPAQFRSTQPGQSAVIIRETHSQVTRLV